MNKSIQVFILLALFVQTIYTLDNLYTSNRNNIYYLENEKKYTWFDALTKCVSMQMALITIDFKEKSEEITELLKKTFDNVNSAWIGGVATGSDYQFAWISNGEKLNFTNWSKGEPTKSEVYNEYCLLTAWPRKLQWDDNDCHSKHGFICEYRNNSEIQHEIKDNFLEEKITIKQLQDELIKNQLLLKFLRNKMPRVHNDRENKMTVRDIYINIKN